MPELPEVESVARGLKHLEGQRLHRIELVDTRVWFESELGPEAFAERRIRQISRRGKYLILRFVSRRTILQHLRMTGKMLELDSPALPAGLLTGPKRLQGRCLFRFERSQLVFFDARRFGTLTAVANEEEYFARKGIAPDPIEGEALARKVFLARLKESNRPVKAALLDQTVAAGVGNIYADEALFAAGIDPRRAACLVKDPERLWREILRVLHASIQSGGTSVIDYLNASGEPGRYGASLRVYGRTGQACSSCQRPVRRIVLSGRSTHFCPSCQRRI